MGSPFCTHEKMHFAVPYIQEQANISVRLHICIVLRQYRTKIVRQ
ncbi:hypothetical protein RUMCAL_01280, partial [Ruminococcus callidus ATCC 27760]